MSLNFQEGVSQASSSTVPIGGKAGSSSKAGAGAVSRPQPPNAAPPASGEGSDDEGDEDRIDIGIIRSFANKIQRMPGTDNLDVNGFPTSRTKIVIPKRGEKDFEPLEETVNLQEMMLQKSREALFDALGGVRGVNSKSISHALLTPTSPYPKLLVARGHILDTLGISIRQSPSPFDPTQKPKTLTQFLPEEALYLLERGSLQIWIGREPQSEEDVMNGVGEWKDEEWGIGCAVEMSVMEGFGAFIGKDGLSWERYQAYSYLKRLGYTVQRTRQFLPPYFLKSLPINPTAQDTTLPRFRSWWFSLPVWISALIKSVGRSIMYAGRRVGNVGLNLLRLGPRRNKLLRGTLLERWTGTTYPSIFSHLRIVPAGHDKSLPPPLTIPPPSETTYDPLIANPYLPFFNVWKPATAWSKAKWDRGSIEGLERQKPDYIAAVVESRNTPLPTIQQLAEVFDQLPDEPKGPVKRQGPQYERKPRPPRPTPISAQPPISDTNLVQRLSTYLPAFLRPSPKQVSSLSNQPNPNPNPLGALRNGDRALIVAVNDSGNNGWVRFGRTGFAEAAVI